MIVPQMSPARLLLRDAHSIPANPHPAPIDIGLCCILILNGRIILGRVQMTHSRSTQKHPLSLNTHIFRFFGVNKPYETLPAQLLALKSIAANALRFFKE
jgi:hypothetical protein